MTTKQIVDAWAEIRKTNNSIPDDVLDYMKDAAIVKLKAAVVLTQEEADLFEQIMNGVINMPSWDIKELKQKANKALQLLTTPK